MTTKKREAIMACAMDLMDAYDNWLDADYMEELEEAVEKYNICLKQLSRYTGKDKHAIASALGNQNGVTYNLDWLRNLGVEI